MSFLFQVISQYYISYWSTFYTEKPQTQVPQSYCISPSTQDQPFKLFQIRLMPHDAFQVYWPYKKPRLSEGNTGLACGYLKQAEVLSSHNHSGGPGTTEAEGHADFWSTLLCMMENFKNINNVAGRLPVDSSSVKNHKISKS